MSTAIQLVYVEDAVAEHSRVQAIRGRLPRAREVPCSRYTEVFNRRKQSFRLQKGRPALILAEKFRPRVLPAPEGYGIGCANNYYFSHMLNCIYDCRYCFLQGMFRSAHYVVFVNYEDFLDSMREAVVRHGSEEVHFFSGYDCDSLALEEVTGFTSAFLPFLEETPKALLELRTKSTNVASLLRREPLSNCVVAFSFTPEESWETLEHGVPPIARRLEAIRKLQEAGWPIGLRFDPLLFSGDFAQRYTRLFADVFDVVDPGAVHSVSFGGFRLPKPFYRRIEKQYPEEPLFAGGLGEVDGQVAYDRDIEQRMFEHCENELRRFVPQNRLFPCVG